MRRGYEKVIVCDAIHEKGFELLRKEDVQIIDASEVSKEELLHLMKDAQVAITRSPTDVDEKFLNSSKN